MSILENQISGRVKFILSQSNNRYSEDIIAPYPVHIESVSPSSNIGNLHPISIGKICRILPFINRVRKCTNCFRWGHSSLNCRSFKACERCSLQHTTKDCDSEPKCINCGGDHLSSDTSCPVFINHKIINTVMAYTNAFYAQAKRTIKVRGIDSCQQAINFFRSHAYMIWNKFELDEIRFSSAGNLPSRERVRSVNSAGSHSVLDDTIRPPSVEESTETLPSKEPNLIESNLDSLACTFLTPDIILHDLRFLYNLGMADLTIFVEVALPSFVERI
ncbi:uncharacterized protein LOC143907651 [Temnothorax americanus]|uniref:uncharacterized protein LOC143907651 n=1 Tax=Temnothorax americanus TaxID=1964332 RepID=UPI0040680684